MTNQQFLVNLTTEQDDDDDITRFDADDIRIALEVAYPNLAKHLNMTIGVEELS